MLMELTVAGQICKTIPCKMHAFCQKAISSELLYSGFVSCNNQVLFMQKNQLFIFPIVGMFSVCKI